ncbi:hypothetical protein [Mesomycoplasma ovipneumoniae]|uniref:hypothetical protein n=1 Tax=Mesomycoplasma ovipneumoniae TaxID=29562 RepID=UPI00311B16A6
MKKNKQIEFLKKEFRVCQKLENRSKYYQCLKPEQKKIIDDIYEKVLKSDNILLDKKRSFDLALDEVRKFETNYNDAIAHKAKSIVKKEKQEVFLASRNYILKEVRKYYGLDSNKKSK